MRELLTVGRQPKGYRIVGVTAVVYVLAAFLGEGLLREVGVGIRLTPGLIFSFGLLFGPAAAWGGAIGHLSTELITGSFGPDTSIGYLVQFGLVVAGYRIWGRLGAASAGERPGRHTWRNLLEYGLVAVVAGLFVAALSGWGSLLLAESPFQAVVVRSFSDQVVSLFVVGTPILYALATWSGTGPLRFSTVERIGTGDTSSPIGSPGVLLLVITVSWCFLGFGAGLVFQMIEVESVSFLRNTIGREAVTFLQLTGPSGFYFQVILGGVHFFACVFVLSSN